MKRLKAEYQALANVFSNHYEGVGCCCHHNPPCGYCTHPGHPESLAEVPEAWVEMLEPLYAGQKQILLGDDTPALEEGMDYVIGNTPKAKEALFKEGVQFYVFDHKPYILVAQGDIERVFGGVA